MIRIVVGYLAPICLMHISCSVQVQRSSIIIPLHKNNNRREKMCEKTAETWSSLIEIYAVRPHCNFGYFITFNYVDCIMKISVFSSYFYVRMQ